MGILEWAKREIALADQRDGTTASTENEDTMDDYVSGCYASALKALSALAEDGHSGMSIGVTMSVLNRLVAWKPLTPITEDDFVEDESDIHANPEWLKEQHLKSSIRARRYHSLVRKEHEDGSITYHDYDRVYCIDVNDEIKNYVAELECAMECENIKMEEGDYDEVPAEVRRQQADRLADMDNTYSILNDKLTE